MTLRNVAWRIEHHRGAAESLHHLPPPEEPTRVARVLTVHRPTVVLGSAQPDSVVDVARAAETGLAVARRRSGGGAVLLVPGEHVWVDLFVPGGDPLWDDDVVAAARWVGHTWERAVARLGLPDTSVHHGGSDAAPWSTLVCFAGRGPGEVLLGKRKLVGVSQRRTRTWVRAQTAVHLRWDPARLSEVLALDDDDRRSLGAVLESAVATVPGTDSSTADMERVVEALVASLPN